jgi:hypothetical protein
VSLLLALLAEIPGSFHVRRCDLPRAARLLAGPGRLGPLLDGSHGGPGTFPDQLALELGDTG